MPDPLPEKCVCGSSFTVEHAMTCSHGGFSFLRHNEIRDLSAKLLKEVYPNVIEPERLCHNVQQTDRMTQDQTSKSTAFDGRRARTHFYVKEFYPMCPETITPP